MGRISHYQISNLQEFSALHRNQQTINHGASIDERACSNVISRNQEFAIKRLK
jgi:hypothetical protein